jgi:hypothetical protein
VNRTYISRFVSLVLLFLLPPLPLLAQEIVLKGRFSDPRGNALPGASTSAQNR